MQASKQVPQHLLAELNGKRPMRASVYTKNYKYLIKTRNRRGDFLQVRTHQLVVHYQGVIPENINSGTNIQTQ